jgi:hypothetical protein
VVLPAAIPHLCSYARLPCKERNVAPRRHHTRHLPCFLEERNDVLERSCYRDSGRAPIAPTLRPRLPVVGRAAAARAPSSPASGHAAAGRAELGNSRLAFSVAPCVAPRRPRSPSLSRARGHGRTPAPTRGLGDCDGERRGREGGLDLAAAPPPGPGVHDGCGDRGRGTGTTSTFGADQGMSTGARR